MSQENLLDKLYEISGELTKAPSASNYSLVMESLRHKNEDVRERAIFISGLRWMDDEALRIFKDRLQFDSESSDNNRRLMIESLVSAAIESSERSSQLKEFLLELLTKLDGHSTSAKAAFIGIQRLNGDISKQQFAVLDYDDVVVVK